MSGSKLCGVCHRKSMPLYYLTLTRVMCSTCYLADKKIKKSLIKKLPAITEVEAPFGWNNVSGSYFHDKKHGQIWADHLWKNTRMGVMN